MEVGLPFQQQRLTKWRYTQSHLWFVTLRQVRWSVESLDCLLHAGKDIGSLQATLQSLRRNGIRPILNYAAENDVAKAGATAMGQSEAEAFDSNLSTYLQTVRDTSNTDGKGFVVLKVAFSSCSTCSSHRPSCNATASRYEQH